MLAYENLKIRLHPRAVDRNGGPGVSDSSHLIGSGHALDNFRFVVNGLIAACKLQDGDTRLLKQLVEFVFLVLDRKPRLRLPIMLPNCCACIE